MVSFGALEVRKGGFLRHILGSYSKLANFFFFLLFAVPVSHRFNKLSRGEMKRYSGSPSGV